MSKTESVYESVEPLTFTLESGGYPLLLPPGTTFSAIEGTEYGSILHPTLTHGGVLVGGMTPPARFAVRETPAEVLAIVRAAQGQIQAVLKASHERAIERRREMRSHGRQVPVPDFDMETEFGTVWEPPMMDPGFYRGGF